VSVFRYHVEDGTSIYFVDTPGFDDTYKKDTDVLREIADYLSESYENQILLSGIIYLHRISDTRLGGSGMRNLRMFKKLVGEEGLANVVLATTMWSMLPSENVGIDREAELTQRSDFWQHMIRQGSKVFRQDRGLQSAKEIVQHITSRRTRPALDIQRDMVDRGLNLDETAAGQEVQAEIAKQQAEHERRIIQMQIEMREAIANRDLEHQEELRQHREEIDRQMRANEEAIQRLKVSKEEIRSEMEAKWEEEKRQLTQYYDAREQDRQERYERERAELEQSRIQQREQQERMEQSRREAEALNAQTVEVRDQAERLLRELQEEQLEEGCYEHPTQSNKCSPNPSPSPSPHASPSPLPSRSPSPSPSRSPSPSPRRSARSIVFYESHYIPRPRKIRVWHRSNRYYHIVYQCRRCEDYFDYKED
jgi:hypothetical protein